MKILVYSDIHANAEAFEKVMENLPGLGPDLLVSLGDVVGYGADPGRCVELVRENSDIRICGNHDLAASGHTEGKHFNGTAALSIEWTRQALNDHQKKLLEEYEPIYSYERCLFAHASPFSPLNWEYIYTVAQAERIFNEFGEKYIFVGHTHIPGVISFDKKNGARVEHGNDIEIRPGARYLINPGSVGQPRDGISAASFAFIDLVKGRIEIHRIAYDVIGAQKKIRWNGLPESLALRLKTAR